MKKRKLGLWIAALCMLGCLMLGAAGCNQKKTYSSDSAGSSIFVYADGRITASLVEEFSADYYDVEELTGIAQDLAQEYNETKSGLSYYSSSQLTEEQQETTLLPVSLDRIKEEGGTITVTFTYASGDDYTAFNQIDIQAAGGTQLYTALIGTGSVEPSGKFVIAQGKDAGEALLSDEIASLEEAMMIQVDYATTIYMERDVYAVTTDVSVISSNGVQTPAGKTSVIVFQQ